ncbi:Hypothetical predicted protein [Paramuricea clavata]|uniref:Uncharacterized protein n=1 Tax=Paramuricea clavata TaxID=317549 RepID=A0A6S7GR45_PARCT|nr:Hypothetical predicted protein [Paramuricea clavata]
MDLIKKMLSIPLERPLTNTQRFTFVSATIAYIIAGLGMTFTPGLWNMAVLLDVAAGGRGYFILAGAGLVDIGLCYVVLSRNKSSQIPNHGPLLGTVVSRLLIINAILITFYTQGIINARFGLMFSILDSTLSIQTYIIWSRENKDASFMKFLQEIWSTVNPFSAKPPPYMIFQALGFAQFFMSFTATSILMSSGVVPSTIQGSHTEGLLRSYFVTMAVHAVLQILASGARNDSFPIASVFYRVIWNIPVFFLLAMTSQIPRGLANILIIYDVMFIVVTVVLFAREHRVKMK